MYQSHGYQYDALRDISVFIDVVWKLNTRVTEVTCGGWSTQPQQIQSYWDTVELKGVCWCMAMPCREPHEPTQEMYFVVTMHSEFKSGWYTQRVLTFVSHHGTDFITAVWLGSKCLKSRVPLIVLVKNDNIDKRRKHCICEAFTAETCLRMLTSAATGVAVSEFTMMLVPNLATRLHWLYHYTIWSRGSSKSLWVCLDIFSTWYALFSCDATSTATHPANCDVLHKALPVFAEAAKLPEQHYECVLVIRLMNTAEEWQQYSQTVASNMTTLYCEGGPVFVLTVTSTHFLQW